MDTELQPGQEVFAFTTGRLDPFQKGARDAFEFMTELDGLVGIHTEPRSGNLLWFFDTENHAKQGRNLAEAKGIQCGTNICRFVVAEDGVPTFDEDWAREHGMEAE